MSFQGRFSIIAYSTCTLVTAVLSYAIYFDHKRRSDPEFRKALKSAHEEAIQAAEARKEAENDLKKEAIYEAVKEVNAEIFPTVLEEREQYFLMYISTADKLSEQGKYVEAAKAYYKSLKVYPDPDNLFVLLEKEANPEAYEALTTMLKIAHSQDTLDL